MRGVVWEETGGAYLIRCTTGYNTTELGRTCGTIVDSTRYTIGSESYQYVHVLGYVKEAEKLEIQTSLFRKYVIY